MNTTPSETLIEALEAKHVAYEVIPHRRTHTAAAEARAIGVEPSHVAKTLVLSNGDGFVRAVVPANERIDLRKVRELLGSDDVRLATERALADAYPEFELGAVPPVGGPHQDAVLVDQRVTKEPTVVFEAGSHEHSVRVGTSSLLAMADARVVDICQD
jgi:Ala-tRNA(Pro) deacylase